MNIRKYFVKFRHKQAKRFLCSADPERLVADSAKKVLKSFKHAALKIPAYKEILLKNNLHADNIKNPEDFRNSVPVLNKKDFFIPFEADRWVGNKRFYKIKSFMTSSGFSRNFAFGVDDGRLGQIRKGVDFTLDYLFNTNQRRTFLINCVPMGVHVITSLPLAETSVRSDMVLALVKKISPKFDQTIIVGDPHFLKKVIEEGIDEGINWKKINLNLICGQDWFPESFRQYMAHLTDMDIYRDNSRMIIATMGMTELGLNIFHESFDTVRIRKHARENNLLNQELFGADDLPAPLLFHYYPMRNYIEEIKDNNDGSALLFSVLNKRAMIPLIRYNSGDSGTLLSYLKLKEILTTHRLLHLLPVLKLPLAGIYGRRNNFIVFGDRRIYPAQIKAGLYEDFDLAGRTTGYFRINTSNDSPVIELQLKPGIIPDRELTAKFGYALLKGVKADIAVKCFTYHQFPYGMELSYEHKFMNIIPDK